MNDLVLPDYVEGMEDPHGSPPITILPVPIIADLDIPEPIVPKDTVVDDITTLVL